MTITAPEIRHELVLRQAPDPGLFRSGLALVLSCTCTAVSHGGRPRREVIEARTRFPAAEALAAWRAWHEERGVIV